MPRCVLANEFLSSGADRAISSFHADIVKNLAETIKRDPLVVVGMAQNPFVRKVRQALTEAAISYTYLEFGSYFSQWQPRLAIKMWSGWPSYPQVFVKGVLIGGASDTIQALQDGSLKKRLQA